MLKTHHGLQSHWGSIQPLITHSPGRRDKTHSFCESEISGKPERQETCPSLPGTVQRRGWLLIRHLAGLGLALFWLRGLTWSLYLGILALFYSPLCPEFKFPPFIWHLYQTRAAFILTTPFYKNGQGSGESQWEGDVSYHLGKRPNPGSGKLMKHPEQKLIQCRRPPDLQISKEAQWE